MDQREEYMLYRLLFAAAEAVGRISEGDSEGASAIMGRVLGELEGRTPPEKK